MTISSLKSSICDKASSVTVIREKISVISPAPSDLQHGTQNNTIRTCDTCRVSAPESRIIVLSNCYVCESALAKNFVKASFLTAIVNDITFNVKVFISSILYSHCKGNACNFFINTSYYVGALREKFLSYPVYIIYSKNT